MRNRRAAVRNGLSADGSSGSLRDDRGVTAVLVALGMAVLLGTSALALDIGNTYQVRRSAQNAADLAALRAAYTECVGDQAAAIAAGEQAAAVNGFSDGAQITVEVTRLDQNEYQAVIETDVDTTFGRVIGFNAVATSVNAVVSCSAETVGGTTLHAHATGCALHPELLVTGDSVEVNGGSHSNGDFKTSGDDITLNDGTTYGENWEDTADNTVTNPSETPGPNNKPWPYEYDIEDFNDATDHAPGFWHSHAAGTTLNGVIPPGVHYSPGDLNINDITIDPDDVTGESGVTLVAEGRITTTTDTLDITAYSGANGLLMFSNNVTECDPNLDDDLAINSQTDNADYEGVLFAPHGKILLRSDGALAVAVWGYFVELRGDPNISLTYPPNAPVADPELTFEQ